MSQTQRIRVLIADDQELVRAGFAMVIDSQGDMQVVGQAGNGAEAVALSRDLKPDVVLMDVRMPGMDGIEATRLITETSDIPTFGSERQTGESTPGSSVDDSTDAAARDGAAEGAGGDTAERTTRVIILTTFDLDEYVMSAINAGASGFLLKDTEPETLLNSIRTVYLGNAIIAPSATKRLIEKMMDGELRDSQYGNRMNAGAAGTTDSAHDETADTTEPTPGGTTDGKSGVAAKMAPIHDPELDELTDREREVLIEVAHGLSNQEIADKLFISLPTVKTHVAHILAKIHARDRVQAVVFAYDNRLV